MQPRPKSFEHLYESLNITHKDNKWSETIVISDILESIVSDLKTWERLAGEGKVDQSLAYEQAQNLYIFAEKYLLQPSMISSRYAITSLAEEPLDTEMGQMLHKVETKLEEAKKSGKSRLITALNMLHKSAKKWEEEYKNGELSYEAANIELSCLYLYAVDLLESGEQTCEPEKVKEYLTV